MIPNLSLITGKSKNSPITCYTTGPESFGISYREGDKEIPVSEYPKSRIAINSRPLHCSELYNLLRDMFFGQGNIKIGHLNKVTKEPEFKYLNVLSVSRTENSGTVYSADPESVSSPVVNLNTESRSSWESEVTEFVKENSIPESTVAGPKLGEIKRVYELCQDTEYTGSVYLGTLSSVKGAYLDIDISFVKSGVEYSRNYLITLGTGIRSMAIDSSVYLEIVKDEVRLSSEDPEVTEYIIESCRLVIT